MSPETRVSQPGVSAKAEPSGQAERTDASASTTRDRLLIDASRIGPKNHLFDLKVNGVYPAKTDYRTDRDFRLSLDLTIGGAGIVQHPNSLVIAFSEDEYQASSGMATSSL
jgi:hypothetical protein